jgi:hypothetical protein
MSTGIVSGPLAELALHIRALEDRATAAERGREEALQEAGRLRARVEELKAAVRVVVEESGVCDCESYEPCAGECCGVGNCTCTPEVLARATAEVTGRG